MHVAIIDESPSPNLAAVIWVSSKKYTTHRALMPSIDRHEKDMFWVEPPRIQSLHPVKNGFSSPDSFAYYRLPPHQLRLSVLKLDGSTFEVQVPKTATVLELKQAVEEVFDHLRKKEGREISWLHVWAHFCLCFGSYKLINDKASLRTLGIKDGDQLCFIRHHSITYNFRTTRRHRNNRSTSRKNTMLRAGLQDFESSSSSDESKQDVCEKCYFDHSDEEISMTHSEFKLVHFLRGWLSCSPLLCSGLRRKAQGWTRPKWFAGD